MQGPHRLEERACSHPSDSTRATWAPARHTGRSWPRLLFWKLSIPLPELPVLSWPHCPFLASSPLPGENFQQSPTQTGPPSRPWPLPPSHQPSPETADGAENTASGTAAGALAAGRGVYSDLSPGTPGEGWPAGSGCPGQPILAPQGLITAENGPCCAGQAQGTGVGP